MENVIFKTFTLVTMNEVQYPTYVEPFVDEDPGDGKCLLIAANKDLTKFGEGIS